MRNSTLRILLTCASLGLTACGGTGEPAKHIANKAIENLGCKVAQSEIWNSLHHVAELGEAYPELGALREALLEAGEGKGWKGDGFEQYVDAFLAYYQITVQGIQQKFAPGDLNGWKKALAEMEIGIRVTDVHAELQAQVSGSLQKLEAAQASLDATCNAPDVPAPTPGGPAVVSPPVGGGGYDTIWQQLKVEDGPEVYGMRHAIATAYQSCDVLSLPVMTSATPSVEGIEIVGTHSSGTGKKRAIASLASVNNSHYYIKGQRLAKNTCVEVRNSPLIYDYGGKPYTTSSKPAELNLFRNAGSGEAVLGIDCSALVFSSLALAGLKMDPDPAKVLKADLVHGINSRAFKEPQSNGLRCLAKVTPTANTTLLAGDVAAINGHVVMIDAIGEDPFGLDRIERAEDCTSSKLTYSGFDFVIAQSSPSKGGIGINRFAARDYLKESTTYREGLTQYGLAACRAKFGLAPNLNSPNLSVVRHKKTAECKAAELTATNQECVDSCRAL